MKTDIRVVDASMLVKALLNEADSDHALGLWEADLSLIATAHAIVECSDASLEKARRHECSESAATDAARALSALPLDWMPIHSCHASTALDAARQGGFASHDAVYLLLAEHHDARLVTADEHLSRAAAESSRWSRRVVRLADWRAADGAT